MPRICSLILLFSLAGTGVGQEIRRPFSLKLEGQNASSGEAFVPVDPLPRINWQWTGQMAFGVTLPPNVMLSCGAGAIRTNFRINGGAAFPGNASAPQPIKPQDDRSKPGIFSLWTQGNIAITQKLDLIPSKAALGQKRVLDVILITYTIENKDTRPHEVGVRMRMDAFCGNNDGPLCVASTQPGKVLNGVHLKDKDLPDWVQVLERPDPKNPGHFGHFTLKMPAGIEGPTNFIHTIHGAGEDGWNINIQPSNGDSDFALLWAPKSIPAGGKRIVGYAYGKGIASNLGGEGKVSLDLTGNFEPGKIITILARVNDPIPGQSLRLLLPEGLVRLEGHEFQPVPPLPYPDAAAVVMWKARVERLGEHQVSIQSSTGANTSRKFWIEKQ